MTERLYYQDPYNREFEASVVRAEPRGELRAVWLDRSSFYPASGGQPFDTGRIGSSIVEAVEEADNGEVVHLVREAAPSDALEPGTLVRCEIDWVRRFDHMQQHTGQHVLSAMFERLFGVRTVSFHLGTAVCTIDLARETTPLQIAEAENGANVVVWENRAVRIRYATAAEAAAMPLRKESARTGMLRLIEVDGVDLSACGGTHVDRTGSIGLIAVNHWERFKGGQRVEFLCGTRALARFRVLRDAGATASALLSAQPGDLPGAIARLQADAREHKRTIAGLEDALALFQAEELARHAEELGLAHVVFAAVDGDANRLKALAAAITARPNFIAVLVSQSTPATVVAARAAGLSVSCRDLVAALTALFGGRGGGRPELAQAGGLAGPVDTVLAAAKRVLEAQ
jgi:alanyl-tRNA synthetase